MGLGFFMIYSIFARVVKQVIHLMQVLCGGAATIRITAALQAAEGICSMSLPCSPFRYLLQCKLDLQFRCPICLSVCHMEATM